MRRTGLLIALFAFAASSAVRPAAAAGGHAPEALAPSASAACVPFGGTIYGWHDTPTDSWYGVGDFHVGRQVRHATVEDPNTGFSDNGKLWLGSETAKFDFGDGDTIELMTDFICEVDPEAIAAADAVAHVNETGYFANGTGRLRRAWGRFNLQGPFGPGVVLPPQITPGANDGWFWIGQYVGSICGVAN